MFPDLRHLYNVRLILRVLAVLCFCSCIHAAQVHTTATLYLAAETARPGETVWAAVRLQMDPDWHTYWKNPGGSGMATTIAWELPPGVTAGEIQWPAPEKLSEAEFTTYILKGDVSLVVPLKLAPDLRPGPLELKGKVTWLECFKQCVQAGGTVRSTLNVGAEAKPSQGAPLISAWQNKLPKPAESLSPRAWWDGPANQDSRPLVVEWNFADASEADFIPEAAEQFEVQPETERLPAERGKIRLRKSVKKLEGQWPGQIAGLLVQVSSAGRSAFTARLNLDSQTVPADAGAVASAPPAAIVALPPLWKMLLYAFIGGLVLNVMPCVLPVIALKILGFVGQSKEDPGKVRKLGLVYTLGVLLSFLVLAGLVIAAKEAGHKAGWGMQFGSPTFLVILTTLVTLVALNLFGVFEINLGGNVMGAAGALASKHGYAGAFFNGVLATILATPCTAPFLGAALGFAFAQSAAVIVAIFGIVAFGLATPYLVLSSHPAWLKFLPKPGAWMERFKIAMGFPMLATAVWLFSLIPLHYGNRTLWLGIFLVLVAFAAWIFGEFVQRGRAHRGLATVATLVLLAGGYFYAIEAQLRWRSPETETLRAGNLKEGQDGIDWKRWSPAAIAEARAAGHPVLVDFTADWCLTCKVNKKLALEISSVRAKLKEVQAVPLLGDYTTLPPAITEELNRYGRAGVPLVLVYPKDPNAAPIVLPELLTGDIVLAALDKAM